MLALLYKYFTEFHIRTIYSSPLRNLTSVNSWQQWSRSTPATCRQVSCQPQSSEGHSLGTSANLPGRSQRRFLFMNTHFPCIYFVCFVLEISCELVVGTFNFVDFVHFVPRKQKGSIKQDLMYEYETLGRPGKGKALHDVIREVEQEQSKNLQFRVEKKGGSMWLHCGKESMELPQEKPPWKPEVFLEPTTQIPFLSNGKTSVRCICFFQESEGPIVSNQETQAGPDILTVPLPGSGKKGPASTISMTSERGKTGPNTMICFVFLNLSFNLLISVELVWAQSIFRPHVVTIHSQSSLP